MGPAKPGCAEGRKAQSGMTRVLAPSLDPSARAGKQERKGHWGGERVLGSGHTETRVRMLTEESFSGGRGGDPGEQPLPWQRSCSVTEAGQGARQASPNNATEGRGDGAEPRGTSLPSETTSP